MDRTASTLVIAVLMIISHFAHATPNFLGASDYQQLNTELFTAELYADTAAPEALLSGANDFTMRMVVTVDQFKKRRFRNLWLEGLAINYPSAVLSQYNAQIARFSRLLKGDLLTGDDFKVIYESGSTTIRLNDIDLLTLPGSQFATLMLSVWIGDVPLSSQFQNNLLEGKKDSALAIDKTFSDDRAGQIENWLGRTRSPQTNPAEAAPKAVAKAAPTANPQPEVIAEATKNTSKPAIVKPEITKPTAPKVAEVKTPEVATSPKDAPRPKIVEAPAPEAPAQQEKTDAKVTEAAVISRTATNSAPVDDTPKPEIVAAVTEPSPAAVTEEAPAITEAYEDEDEEFSQLQLEISQSYYVELVRAIEKHKTTPFKAFQRNWEGSLRLQIEIDKQGNVINKQILQKADKDLFNKQALTALKKAEPLPPIPTELNEETYLFSVLMDYRLAR